jgi:DNA-binding NtrC family response regulator
MTQKLLLIEEDRQLLSLIGDFLTNLGYEVHRAQEFDEAEALIKNYHYAIIITGTQLAQFGAPDHSLVARIEALVPRPRIIYMKETLPRPNATSSENDGPELVVEKPVSLLRLGKLMRELVSA